MKCAVVNPESGDVVNTIVAREGDLIDGFSLVPVPDGRPIDNRWVWNDENGFKLNAAYQAMIDAEAIEVEQEGLEH